MGWFILETFPERKTLEFFCFLILPPCISCLFSFFPTTFSHHLQTTVVFFIVASVTFQNVIYVVAMFSSVVTFPQWSSE